MKTLRDNCLNLLCAFFLCAAQLAHAQAPALLYEVSAPTAEASSAPKIFLYFTLPYAKADFYPISDQVLQAYKQADAVGIEADISDEKDNVAAAQSLRYGKKDQLKNHLSPATWASLNKMLGKQALQFRGDHAVSVAMGLRLSAAIDLGYQPELSGDLHFLRAARHDLKAVVEFDNIKARYQSLAKLGNKEGDAYLNATLKTYQSGELTKEIQTIEEAWRKADSEMLCAAYTNAVNRDAGSQKIHALLISERNAGIVEQLQTQANQGKKVFAAMDTARLCGEKSILSILKNQGYDIKQVTP